MEKVPKPRKPTAAQIKKLKEHGYQVNDELTHDEAEDCIAEIREDLQESLREQKELAEQAKEEFRDQVELIRYDLLECELAVDGKRWKEYGMRKPTVVATKRVIRYLNETHPRWDISPSYNPIVHGEVETERDRDALVQWQHQKDMSELFFSTCKELEPALSAPPKARRKTMRKADGCLAIIVLVLILWCGIGLMVSYFSKS